MESKDGIEVMYAPFDYIETRARLVVVGITPGMTQAVNATNAAARAKEESKTQHQILVEAKSTASFSGGAIRNNLVSMLDAIGVADHLGVDGTAELFRNGSSDVHFTSALRYPVFVNGKNYNGTPNMLKTPMLKRMIDTYLTEEALLLPEAIWLPLGPQAQIAVQYLIDTGNLDQSKVLNGLPHPSGANSERVAVFLGRKDPALASSKTKPAPLLEAYSRLSSQIATMNGGAL